MIALFFLPILLLTGILTGPVLMLKLMMDCRLGPELILPEQGLQGQQVSTSRLRMIRQAVGVMSNLMTSQSRMLPFLSRLQARWVYWV